MLKSHTQVKSVLKSGCQGIVLCALVFFLAAMQFYGTLISVNERINRYLVNPFLYNSSFTKVIFSIHGCYVRFPFQHGRSGYICC